MDSLAYKFDIVLRGRRSTPFENGWRGTDGPELDRSEGIALADRRALHSYRRDAERIAASNRRLCRAISAKRWSAPPPRASAYDRQGPCHRRRRREPLKDALVEIWQADAAGLYNSPQERRGKADPAFHRLGRQPTDGAPANIASRRSSPGRVPFVDGRLMAPHMTFWIVARGINIGLHTRMYFSDEAAANAEMSRACARRTSDRVATFIAQRSEEGRQGDLSHSTSDCRASGRRYSSTFNGGP